MLPAKLHSESGVSLVELIVVILVISVVASLALLNRGSANEIFQRQNASRELKVAFERARFDSVKRRAVGGAAPQAEVIVTPSTFTLRTYATNSAAATDIVTDLPAGISIALFDRATTTTSNVTTFSVNFDMRGETPQSPEPMFMVCNGSCPSNPTSSASSQADFVLVTPTGTVNLLPGNPGLIPAFNNPTVSTVTADTSINYDVVLP